MLHYWITALLISLSPLAHTPSQMHHCFRNHHNVSLLNHNTINLTRTKCSRLSFLSTFFCIQLDLKEADMESLQTKWEREKRTVASAFSPTYITIMIDWASRTNFVPSFSVYWIGSYGFKPHFPVMSRLKKVQCKEWDREITFLLTSLEKKQKKLLSLTKSLIILKWPFEVC